MLLLAAIFLSFFSNASEVHNKAAPKEIQFLYKRCYEPSLPNELKNEKPLASDVRSVTIQSPSGHIDARYKLNDSKISVLYFHGQGETVKDLQKFVDFFDAKKVNFVTFDYPCFGLSEGSPSEASLGDAGHAVINWLESFRPDDKIVLWGQSLGAAAVLQSYKVGLRNEGFKVDKIVLISPWDTYQNACRYNIPFVMKWLNLCEDDALKGNEYKNVEIGPLVKAPTLVVYTEGDDKVPPAESATVAKSIKNAQSIVLDKSQDHKAIVSPANFQKIMGSALEGL